MRNRVLVLGVIAALCHLAVFTLSAHADDPPGSVPPWGRADGEMHEEPAAHPKEESAHEGPEEEHHPELFEGEVVERPVFWVRGEYLLWWTKNGNIPTLLTRGETTDPLPGALGQPNTKVLYSGDVAFHERSGARFFAGMALGPQSRWSVEANYFFLNARQTDIHDVSSGNPTLARPFTDATTGLQNSSIVTYPGILAGSIDIASTSYLQGGEGNLQVILWDRPRARVQALTGLRYLDLAEALTIQENTKAAAGAPELAGRTIQVIDRFGVNNHFYGGQIGMNSEFRVKRLSVAFLAKVGFGSVQETAHISGQTHIDTAVPTNIAAGLLAVNSNSGEFNRTAFAVVPELGVNVGLQLTPRLTALVGYTFIYWNRVIRPGDQVNTTVNPNLVPTSDTFGAGGPRQPAFAFHETDYWAQGVNFGLQYRY